MPKSIEVVATEHLPQIFADLQQAAANRYLLLDEFDHILSSYGLLDPNTPNGERSLQRNRARYAVNRALAEAGIRERLLAVSASDKGAPDYPGERSVRISEPISSFGLEAAKRQQRLRNGMGRARSVLTELQDVAMAIDVDQSVLERMGKAIGMFDAARSYVEFQLAEMETLAVAIVNEEPGE